MHERYNSSELCPRSFSDMPSAKHVIRTLQLPRFPPALVSVSICMIGLLDLHQFWCTSRDFPVTFDLALVRCTR